MNSGQVGLATHLEKVLPLWTTAPPFDCFSLPALPLAIFLRLLTPKIALFELRASTFTFNSVSLLLRLSVLARPV